MNANELPNYYFSCYMNHSAKCTKLGKLPPKLGDFMNAFAGVIETFFSLSLFIPSIMLSLLDSFNGDRNDSL